MSESKGLIKSHIVKKYWMALTGLFLCLFLIGHLLGNLQLLATDYEGILKFNEYAVFMTSNPIIRVLSILTYISIIFHAIDGIVIEVANRKARPKSYAYNKPSKNSMWASRNMGVLGTIILAYIVVHMQNFWYKFKWGEMPFMNSKSGAPLLNDGTVVENGVVDQGNVILEGNVVGPAMRDLYTVVSDSFQNPILVGFYVIAMVAIAFHLSHGFASAFQSLGLRNDAYTSIIKKVGYAFAIVIPTLFAIIPVYMYFAA